MIVQPAVPVTTCIQLYLFFIMEEKGGRSKYVRSLASVTFHSFSFPLFSFFFFLLFKLSYFLEG